MKTTTSTAHLLMLFMAFLAPSLGYGQTAPNPPVLCIDGENCPAEPKSTSGIKWHPGHYLDTDTIERVSLDDPKNLSATTLKSIIANTPFKGALVRYGWAVLEPKKNEYDFSRIRAHRDTLATIGKRLIVQIQDRDFHGDDPPPPHILPSYLLTESVYEGGWAPRGNSTGAAPKLWLPAVMDRQIALQAALAAEFDSDPIVEVLSFEETALFNVKPPGYTVEKMATQYKRLADAMNASWSRTTICILTNFFDGASNLAPLIDYFIARRICVGGPDVMPNNKTTGSLVISGQADGKDRRNSTAIFYHNEWQSLKGTWTIEQLHDYGHNVNGQHYTTWVRKMDGTGLTYPSDVLPWITATNPPTRTACPDNYKGRCNSD